MDGSYDEVFAAPGQPRAHAVALAAALADARPRRADRRRPPARRDLHAAGDHVRRRRVGRTARRPGARPAVPARPRPADHPRRASGATIKRGLAQRIRALNAFVDDVYHAREIVHDGIVPWELIVSRSAFARAAHGIRPPGGVYCHVSGCDLVRDADGTLEGARGQRPHAERDLLRAREPRRDDAAAARAVRVLPRAARRPLPGAAAHGADRGRADERRGGGDRRRLDARARSTPPTSSTRSSRARWASSWSRRPTSSSATPSATSAPRNGLQRVHAIYRRIDDDFMDPLEFRPDSLLGVPGLMRAYRAGTVAIVNAVGTGVADDKAIYHYVPGDDPLLPRRGADPRRTSRPT